MEQNLNKKSSAFGAALMKFFFGKEMEGTTPKDRIRSIIDDPKEWLHYIARSTKSLFTLGGKEARKAGLIHALFSLLTSNFYSAMLPVLVFAGLLYLNIRVTIAVVAVIGIAMLICGRSIPHGFIRYAYMLVALCLTATCLLYPFVNTKTTINPSPKPNPSIIVTPDYPINPDKPSIIKPTQCVSCRGSGYCRECNGTGTVRCNPYMGSCFGKHYACKGLGCSGCGHTGRCTYCNGTTRKDCSACYNGKCSICGGKGSY